jgi:hypothetical protein
LAVDIYAGLVQYSADYFRLMNAKTNQELRTNFSRGEMKALVHDDDAVNTNSFHVRKTIESSPTIPKSRIVDIPVVDVENLPRDTKVRFHEDSQERTTDEIDVMMAAKRKNSSQETRQPPKKIRPWEEDEVMIDVPKETRDEGKRKGSFKPVQPSYIFMNELGNPAVYADVIADGVLNQRIDIPVKELLALAPTVRKEIGSQLKTKRIETQGPKNIVSNVELDELFVTLDGPVECAS